MTRMDILEERNKLLTCKNAALEKKVLKIEKQKEEEEPGNNLHFAEAHDALEKRVRSIENWREESKEYIEQVIVSTNESRVAITPLQRRIQEI